MPRKAQTESVVRPQRRARRRRRGRPRAEPAVGLPARRRGADAGAVRRAHAALQEHGAAPARLARACAPDPPAGRRPLCARARRSRGCTALYAASLLARPHRAAGAARAGRGHRRERRLPRAPGPGRQLGAPVPVPRRFAARGARPRARRRPAARRSRRRRARADRLRPRGRTAARREGAQALRRRSARRATARWSATARPNWAASRHRCSMPTAAWPRRVTLTMPAHRYDERHIGPVRAAAQPAHGTGLACRQRSWRRERANGLQVAGALQGRGLGRLGRSQLQACIIAPMRSAPRTEISFETLRRQRWPLWRIAVKAGRSLATLSRCMKQARAIQAEVARSRGAGRFATNARAGRAAAHRH